jgi:hypothetical protein
MHRPSAEEFLLTVLNAAKDLPPDFAQRLAEILEQHDVDRAAAIRRLFEEFAGD